MNKIDRLYKDIRTRYTTLCNRTKNLNGLQAMEYRTIDRKNNKTVMVLASHEQPKQPGRGLETITEYVYFYPIGDTHIKVHDENGEHILRRRFPVAGRENIPVSEAVHALIELKSSWVPNLYFTYRQQTRNKYYTTPNMPQEELRKWYQKFYNLSSLRYLEDNLTSA